MQTRAYVIAAAMICVVAGLVACSAFIYSTKDEVQLPAVRKLRAAGHKVDLSIGRQYEADIRFDYQIKQMILSEGVELLSLVQQADELSGLETLMLGPGEYHDLSPIESFSGLKVLIVKDCPVEDLSFLQQLRQLETLSLKRIPASQIPSLIALKKLDALQFSDMDVDLNAVANLNLVTIFIDSGQIHNASALGTLPKLETVLLTNTTVHGLSPLGDAESLSTLSLSRVKMKDLALDFLAKSSTLEELEIRDVPILSFPRIEASELTSVELHNTALSKLTNIGRLRKLKNLDLHGSPVANLAPLAGLEVLEKLDLSQTNVADLTPLARLKSLVDLNISGTRVRDMQPLFGLPNLAYLRISSSSILEGQLEKFIAERPLCNVEFAP